MTSKEMFAEDSWPEFPNNSILKLWVPATLSRPGTTSDV